MMMKMMMKVMMMMLLHGTEAKMDIITSKQDVPVGEDILLLCKAGGEGDILWLKDGEDITDEEQVTKQDESTSKLLVRGAAARDAGRYTCQCEFDSGHRDEVTTQLYVYEGPSFGNTSTYHEFLEGTDGVLPCHVTGQPAVDVHWLRNREPLSSDGGRRVRQRPDGAARIDAVRREDAGTYVCQAQIRGRPVTQELRVSVVVTAPASARLRVAERRVLAGPDTNVSLCCLVDGVPKPNVSWTTPALSDPTRRHFNSDRSQMTISSVGRADGGEYVCTAGNKISESSATFRLHVDEAPEVFVSAELQRASLGDKVSVSCNVSGRPQPELHWLNKHNGHTLDSSSAPVRAVGGALVIDAVAPSDGGTYSCMAVSSSGNASRDVAIHTQPGAPRHPSVSPGPASVLFSLESLPVSGGTPISGFVLQWRRRAAAAWEELTVPASGPLSVSSLQPYTLYTVRLAAQNAVGVGQFSDTHAARTLGVRGEPDRPVLLTNEMRVEGNSFSIPLQPADDGGAALLHFDLRYKQAEEGTEWTEMELPPSADSVSLKDLSFGSDYRLEVVSINRNGSSIPAIFNFTIAEPPVPPSRLSDGSVVGIVMVVFLAVFLAVDAACCYRNRCGLLMSIALKVFGHKVPGLRRPDQGEGTNGEVKLKSISTPRGSVQLSEAGEQKLSQDGGPGPEVTCDKAPLTQHQKNQAGRELRPGNA